MEPKEEFIEIIDIETTVIVSWSDGSKQIKRVNSKDRWDFESDLGVLIDQLDSTGELQ